jgi:hypothetical protein
VPHPGGARRAGAERRKCQRFKEIWRLADYWRGAIVALNGNGRLRAGPTFRRWYGANGATRGARRGLTYFLFDDVAPLTGRVGDPSGHPVGMCLRTPIARQKPAFD